uniref:adhesion G protein-coupled receptor E1-like n=1 Tax=Pristiophorus japonicus TaxID=55135 RepID=UPI00398F545A
MESGTLYLILVAYFGILCVTFQVTGVQKCPPGFLATPTGICIDENECGSDNVITCGWNTECHNTPGSFYCTCETGYVTKSGKTNFTTRISCQDDNECGGDDNTVITLCGAHTECYNTPGSYYCTCKKGYINPSGNTNFNSRKTCHDDNECGGGDNTVIALCGANTECYNTPGSYYCTCKKGYINPSGITNFKSRTNCHDIDECLVDPCGPHGICSNTQGSFTCEGAPTQSTTSSPTEIDLIKVDMEQCSLNNFPEAGQVFTMIRSDGDEAKTEIPGLFPPAQSRLRADTIGAFKMMNGFERVKREISPHVESATESFQFKQSRST